MKHVAWLAMTALALLAASAVPFSAQARVGETPEQCIVRYGKPIAFDTGDLKLTKFAEFTKNGIGVITTYSNGVCVEIHFRKTTGTPLALWEMDALLAANGQGQSWTHVALGNGDFSFTRLDGKVSGKYSTKDNSLILSNLEWIRGERARHHQDSLEKLKDF